MSDHDDHEHILGGAAIPFPPELLSAMRADHDRAHLKRETEEARESRFLDSLDVDGLLALRYIVRCNPDNAFANNSRYDGMIEVLLRRVHGVDPETGEDPRALLDAAAGPDELPTTESEAGRDAT